MVENDLASRELLARVLRGRGCEAHTAIGAAKAAQVLADDIGPFDLMILDMNVDGHEGAELLRQVAVLPKHQRPRRIAVINENAVASSSALAGIDLPIEQFGKPVHFATLMKLVDALRDFKV